LSSKNDSKISATHSLPYAPKTAQALSLITKKSRLPPLKNYENVRPMSAGNDF